MNAKAIVLDLLEQLPDDVELKDIAKAIRFVAGVREGLDELDNGEGVSIEEVETRLGLG